MISTSAKKIGIAIVVCAMAAIVAFCVCANASLASEPDSTKRGDEVKMNDKGQTFGTTYTNDDGTVGLTDLTRVQATNGEVGYLSVDEMETVCLAGAQTPDEQAALAVWIGDEGARGLVAASEAFYGREVIGFAEARDTVSIAKKANGAHNSYVAFAKYVEELTDGEVLVTEEDYRAIFDEAKKVVAVSVPVYLEDGETVIGEYIVDRM